MGILGLKQHKPRQFDYRPRFYDPEKEAREQRKKEILGERAYENDDPKEYKPGQYIGELRMRRGIIVERGRKKAQPNIIRILIFLVLIGAILFFVYL